MKYAGYFLMVLGLFIMAFGAGQLAWVSLASPDPNPNPVGNGMLFTLCWFVGIIVAGGGAMMAGLVSRRLW
jgi:hypothetical protein